jgi:hypothetical protein
MRIIGSLSRAALLAGILALTLATSVFAHDCFNASASAQGNLSKAQNSQAWVLAVDVRQLIATGSSGFVTGAPVLNACQQTVFLAAYAQSGFPLVFTLGAKQAQGTGGVIAANNPNMTTKLGGNGKGIDHFEAIQAALVNAVNASYGAAFGASC